MESYDCPHPAIAHKEKFNFLHSHCWKRLNRILIFQPITTLLKSFSSLPAFPIKKTVRNWNQIHYFIILKCIYTFACVEMFWRENFNVFNDISSKKKLLSSSLICGKYIPRPSEYLKPNFICAIFFAYLHNYGKVKIIF